MKGMSESLAGRVSVTELSGLSLREIFGVTFNRHFVPNENYLSEREKYLINYENIWDVIHKGEILKSYSNEGLDYRFSIFYYRGKDKRASGENEIDLIIEENGMLYPIEIKMTGNPRASMAAANPVLDKIEVKKRGMGVILCMVDKKTYLRENLVALPVMYI